MFIEDLRVNYQQSPGSVDTARPRFSWKLRGGEGLTQTACQIRVATSQEKLASPDLWDSGRLETMRNWAQAYDGTTLPPFSLVFWEVTAWGQNGEQAVAQAVFATGRLDSPWPAEWFSAGVDYESMPVFRRELYVEPGFLSARLYVCGLGSYEVFLNGQKLGVEELEPAWTNYDKSVLYAGHDVTALLKEGINSLGLMLGNGMYHIDQSGRRFAYSRHSFGPQKATAYLKIWRANGSVLTIGDAEGWHAAPGPITFSCIYGGEDVDARLDLPGFSDVGFREDARWQAVVSTDPPKGLMRGREHPPIRKQRVLSPVRSQTVEPDTVIYDFGRNFAGRVSLTVQGALGQTVEVRYAELLRDGDIVPFARGPETYMTCFTLGSGQTESFSPRFTYLGFRYARVTTKARVLDIRGEELFADFPPGGQFSCSKQQYNDIHALILRAMESNAKSVFTDCPHREKLGWLEQLHLIGPGILSNFDAAGLFSKMLADMREAQLDNGLVPNIAPEYRVFNWMPGFRDSPEWGSACVLAAWQAYRHTGDIALLEDNYLMMARYARYLLSMADHHILRFGLGDWLDVGSKKALAVNTPLPVTPTCTLYQVLCTLADIAGLLGMEDEADTWCHEANSVREAFNREFFNPRLGMYANGSQTALSMPLLFGMVDKEHEQQVLSNLVEDIREHGNHITGGDVGHGYIFEALARFGRSDVVADMLNQEDCPSYGFHVLSGATTLPEAWDGARPGFEKGSQNHLMMGGIDAWFFRHLAGLSVETGEDAVRLRFAPQPVAGVTWAKASLMTPAGEASCFWQREADDGEIRYELTMPPGAEALILLPGQPAETIRGQQTVSLLA